MADNKSKNHIKGFIDGFLLLNLFLVIIFAIYFLFAIVMQINGKYIFINIFQKIWDPFIVPVISILIGSSLINGFISWFQQKVRSLEEDI